MWCHRMAKTIAIRVWENDDKPLGFEGFANPFSETLHATTRIAFPNLSRCERRLERSQTDCDDPGAVTIRVMCVEKNVCMSLHII